MKGALFSVAAGVVGAMAATWNDEQLDRYIAFLRQMKELRQAVLSAMDVGGQER